MAILKKRIFRKFIKHFPLEEHPTLASLHTNMASSMKGINIALWAMVIIPATLFAATFAASIERTPITGRWRMILLSPEEERQVSNDLVGNGWLTAVTNVLYETSPNGMPKSVFPFVTFVLTNVLQSYSIVRLENTMGLGDLEKARSCCSAPTT